MKKKMQAGGVVAQSKKKAPMVDPNGAYTKLQEKTLGKYMKSQTKAKDGGKFGMLSVKAGIDKNPNPTAADRIAGAKMKAGKAMYGKTMKAKSGTKMKKMMGGGKCKNGC